MDREDHGAEAVSAVCLRVLLLFLWEKAWVKWPVSVDSGCLRCGLVRIQGWGGQLRLIAGGFGVVSEEGRDGTVDFG